MKQTDHIVSIILPVHNAGRFLHDSLESLLRQTYDNIEVIAIDDNSKDGSYGILKTLGKQDKRLKVYRNKKRYGLAICLNRALRRAKGQFIGFMDPTHVSARSRIQKQLNFLLRHPKVVAVGLQCKIIDHKNRNLGKTEFPTAHAEIYKTLPKGSSMLFETALINKQLLPKDLLKFSSNAYPFVYAQVLMQCIQYGLLANLMECLYSYRKTTIKTYKELRKVDHWFSYVKLWLTSIAQYDYRPSLRSFF